MSELWYDTRDGKLLAGDDAVEPRLMGAGPGDVMPLRELINGNSTDFPLDRYDKLDVREFTEEDYRNVGRWILNILDPDAQMVPISWEHIRRLYSLGLGPSKDRFMFRFGNSITALRDAIGSRHIAAYGAYNDWTFENYEEYVNKVETMLGRKPEIPDFDELCAQGKGPSAKMIIMNAGLRKIHARNGYPQPKYMDEDDIVEWGADVFDANPDLKLTEDVVRILSKRNAGPCETIIRERVGWHEFRSRAKLRQLERIEIEESRRNEKLAQYASMFKEGSLPEEWASLTNSALIKAVGTKQLIKFLAPEIPDELQYELALRKTKHVVSFLQRKVANISLYDIEVAAIELDVFDDIWPEQRNLDRLKVTDEEYQARRAPRNARQRAYTRRNRQLATTESQ